MNEKSEVVFVFLGKELPKYAISSLILAQKLSGLKVCLIANKEVKSQVNLQFVNFIKVEDFYDESRFKMVERNVLLPREFRDGFWLKTLERFFVLHQYMTNYSIPKIFHAELDQLLFRCDELVHNLNKINQEGVFIPFHSKEKVIASILFCNNVDRLNSFLNFAQKCKEFDNEMHLLALWASHHPQELIALPTIKFEGLLKNELSSAGINFLNSSQIGGIVDAAQLGQWVAGEDPRNVPLSNVPKNKYFQLDKFNTLKIEDLKSLNFSISPNNELFCSFDGTNPVQIFNLHIHSKIHLWLRRSELNLKKLIEFANGENPVKIPTTRTTQIKNAIIVGFNSLKKNPSEVLRNRLFQIFRRFLKIQ